MNIHHRMTKLVLALASLPCLAIAIYYLYVPANQPLREEPNLPHRNAQSRETLSAPNSPKAAPRGKELETRLQENARASADMTRDYESRQRSPNLRVIKDGAERRYERLFKTWGLTASEANRILDIIVQRDISALDAVVEGTRAATAVTNWNDVDQLQRLVRERRGKLESVATMGEVELLSVLGPERLKQLQELDRHEKEKQTKSRAD